MTKSNGVTHKPGIYPGSPGTPLTKAWHFLWPAVHVCSVLTCFAPDQTMLRLPPPTDPGPSIYSLPRLLSSTDLWNMPPGQFLLRMCWPQKDTFPVQPPRLRPISTQLPLTANPSYHRRTMYFSVWLWDACRLLRTLPPAALVFLNKLSSYLTLICFWHLHEVLEHFSLG